MSKRNNRQKGAPETWIHGGPDQLKHPRYHPGGRTKRFDFRLVFPWGRRNRRAIKQSSSFRSELQ